MIPVEITREELVGEPEPRKLVTGKSIISFNVKLSEKIENLNTGHKFDYQSGLYEIMNREPVDAPVKYIKFNCVPKITDSTKD
jgi:hypothetical protein